MDLLTSLKNFNADKSDLDEMVLLSAQGRLYVAECEALKMPVPEWVTEGLESLRTEVKSQRRDALKKALKDAKARQAVDLTADERRAARQREIEQIESQLAE